MSGRSKIVVTERALLSLAGQSHLKPSTHSRYSGLIRSHVAPSWGDVPLSDISHADVFLPIE